MHIPLGKGCFNVRVTKEDPIPYMAKIKLAYIPVQSWIIYPNVDRLPKGICTYTHSYYISCSCVGLSSDLKKSTVVDESLSVSINPMFCYENTFNYSMESQQNEKSTQIRFICNVHKTGCYTYRLLGATSFRSIQKHPSYKIILGSITPRRFSRSVILYPIYEHKR